jgi:acetylornithine/succinyldiaminopimelate/putrescine aminotransferase
MFAIDKFGVSPDIIVLAKALGGGLPLGAFIASGEIMSALASDPPLGHITTFGGHPLCCAAGLASLDVIIGEELVKGVPHKSDLFRKCLTHNAVKEIRGDGLLLAVVMDSPEKAAYAVTYAPEYGLILDYFLFCDNAFRIAPPLTITDDEIHYSCKQLGRLLDDMIKKV